MEPPVEAVGAAVAEAVLTAVVVAVGEPTDETVDAVVVEEAVAADFKTLADMAVVAPVTLLALMKMPFRESGLSWYLGSTSITTKYWFREVYMVETSRWPKAS
jgi:hypothetical protein